MFINGVQKFLVSSTPPTADWGPTTLVDGGLATFVADLKRQPGGDIGVHGSIALTQTLLEDAAGRRAAAGRRPGVAACAAGGSSTEPAQTRLTLSEASTSSTGYLLLDYRVGN